MVPGVDTIGQKKKKENIMEASTATLYNFGDNYQKKLDASLMIMANMVREYKTHPEINKLAMSLVSRARERDHLGEAKQIYYYVRDQIPFRNDVLDVETIRTPIETLRAAGGDCDCKIALLNSLLETVGLPTRFVAISVVPGGSPLSHIYSQVYVKGRWYSMDPARDPKVIFGVEPKGRDITARNIYEYNGK